MVFISPRVRPALLRWLSLVLLFLPAAVSAQLVDFQGDRRADLLIVTGDEDRVAHEIRHFDDGQLRPWCGTQTALDCGLGDIPYLGHPLTRLLPGDFDGDGKTDLIIVSGAPEYREFAFLRGGSDGLELVCQGGGCGMELPRFFQHSRTEVLVGDFGGIGRDRLLAVSGDSRESNVTLIETTPFGLRVVCDETQGGCGTLTPEPYHSTWGMRWFAADFLGDGSAQVLAMHGSGKNAVRRLWTFDSKGFADVCGSPSTAACNLPTQLAVHEAAMLARVADLNGDDRADLLLIDKSSGAHAVFYGSERGFTAGPPDEVFPRELLPEDRLRAWLADEHARLLVGRFSGADVDEILLLPAADVPAVLRRRVENRFTTVCVGCGLSALADTPPSSRVLVSGFTGSGRSQMLVLDEERGKPFVRLKGWGAQGFQALCGSSDCRGDRPDRFDHRSKTLPADAASPPRIVFGGRFHSDAPLTQRLRAALASSSAEVYLDGDENTRYLSGPLQLPDNTILHLQRGVTLEAAPGSLRDPRAVFLAVYEVSNVTIRGESGARIRMPRAEYQEGEWRHSISIRGGSNVSVRDLVLTGSGGDGVYIGRGYRDEYLFSRNVVIKGLTIEGHPRNGISVISACGLLIEDNLVRNTVGDRQLAANGPWAGIDLEPNLPDEVLRRVLVRNNRFVGNRRYGIFLWLPRMASAAPDHELSIRFEDNYVSDTVVGVAVALPVSNQGERMPGGTVDFLNTHIENTDGAGFFIYNKPLRAAALRVRGLRMNDTNLDRMPQPRVALRSQVYEAPLVIAKDRASARRQPQGGLRFDEVSIGPHNAATDIWFANNTRGSYIQHVDITGSVAEGAPRVRYGPLIDSNTVRVRLRSEG